MSGLKVQAEQLVKVHEMATRTRDPEQFGRLRSLFDDFRNLCRETMQEQMAAEGSRLVEKLQGSQPLTEGELDQIKQFIVGDAEYYTTVENNFDEWLVELDRLMREVKRRTDGVLDVHELAMLKALSRDATNLLPSIVYYLSDRQRLERFQSAIVGSLDMQTRMMLASIIKTKLESSES